MRRLEGATDADVCRAYVCEVRCPPRRAGAIVIAATLAAHKAAGVQEALAATGARRRSRPPYAPDLPPLARCWATIKTSGRAAKARTREARDTAVACALAPGTASDARAWFAHSGDGRH